MTTNCSLNFCNDATAMLGSLPDAPLLCLFSADKTSSAYACYQCYLEMASLVEEMEASPIIRQLAVPTKAAKEGEGKDGKEL